MKKVITKEQIISRLTKLGHNKDMATGWTNEHFEYASKYYFTVSKIADVISRL
tara:strand:- start:2135 stop:2293 length:159 start_codon:yes stop_codon:yes gene_type:complete